MLNGVYSPTQSLHIFYCLYLIFLFLSLISLTGIVAKFTQIRSKRKASLTELTISARIVKRFKMISGPFLLPNFPPRISLSIQIMDRKKKSCLRGLRKKPKKFILFFDEPVRGKSLTISQDAPIFITKYKPWKRKAVTKAISKEFCNYYF